MTSTITAGAGLLTIGNGGTIELASGAPTILFQDGKADLLRLDQPGSFTGTIVGFDAGDTIDLGLLPVTAVSYGYDGVLTLSNAGTVVARLNLMAGTYPVGSWQVSKGAAGGFLLSVGADGHTRLSVTTPAPVTSSGHSGAYGAAASWAGGVAPGAGSAVTLGPATTPYVVATGTVNAAAGVLLMTGAQATLEVDRSMLAAWQPAVVAAGTLAIAANAVLQSSGLVQLSPAASTRIDRNGMLVLGGLANGSAVTVEGTLLVNGGKILAGPKQAGANATGGATAIGLGDGAQPAVVTVQAGGQVNDTGTRLGAGPASSGTLVISGAGTSWTDSADPTRTQDTTGTMLVGVPDPGISAGATAASPATLLVTQGAVLTDAGYAEIGAGPGSAGVATVSSGAQWRIAAGALSVGAGGSGTLSILNGGTVAAGSGGAFLAGGTALAMRFGVAAGQSGSGAITVSGTGSVLLTPGSLILGGSGQGAMTVAAGGLAEAGSLQVWQGSVAEVDPGGAVDVGGSGTAAAGAVLIEAGHTLLGDGLVAANVVNNGTVLAVAGGPSATLEITGSLSGTGTIALAGGAAAQIDGTLGAGQTVLFSPGGGVLRLRSPSSTIASALAGLDTGDKISSPQWTQILSVQAVGTSVAVRTKTSTVILSNVSFAPGASRAFVWYKDAASGNWTIEVAAPAMDWNGPSGGDLGGAGNWQSEQTGAAPATPPGPSNSLVFASTGGVLTGRLTALDASFGGLSPWTLAGANLTLTGHPSPPNPPLALSIGTSVTLNGATITAAGSTVIGAYGGACVAVLGGAAFSTAGAAIGDGVSLTGTLAVNTGGTALLGGSTSIGRDLGSAGTLNVGTGGTVRTSASPPGPALVIGDAGRGSAMVAGSGSLLDTTAGPIAISAHGGAGTLTVANGGTVLAGTPSAAAMPAVTVGVLGPGTLAVNGTGSRLAASGGMRVGLGGPGTLSVTGGAVASIGPDASGQGGLSIGVGTAASAQGTGSATVTTGGVLRSTTWLSVGGGGETGTLSVNGGTIEAGLSLVAGVGGGGSGSITIGAGGTLTVGTQPGNAALLLGLPRSSGSLAVGAGGSLNAKQAAVTVGAGGQGVLSLNGGTASAGAVTVGGAGSIAVGGGATLSVTQAITIAAAGALTLQSGRVAAAQVANAGRITGAGTIAQAAVVNTGTVTAALGTLVVEGSVAGTGTLAIGPQANLQLDAGIGAGQTIAFQGGTGTLTIEAPPTFAGTIAGFGAGDRIALAATGPVSQTWDAASGTLRLTGGGQSIGLHISGTHTAADFATAIIPIGVPSGGAAVPAGGTLTATVSNTTVQPGTGTHTLYLSGTGDTIVVPPAGQGFLDIFGPALANKNQLDFRQALSAAGWPGSLATLSQFMQVGTTLGAALVSISPKGAQAPATVLRLEGQNGLTLSGLVSHALL